MSVSVTKNLTNVTISSVGVSGRNGTSGTSGTFSNRISSSIYISGSIVPNTAPGEFTSSFSLGSATNAWKELWVSNGSVNFVDPLSGNTASISLNENNVISVQQIESIGNLNVTGSLGVNFIEIGGEVDWPIVNEGDTPSGINLGPHKIFSSKLNKNLAIHSNYPINIHLGKVSDENSKLNITGSVKLHGDKGLGRINPFDTTLEVIGNSEFSGSLNVTGSVNIDNVIKLTPVETFPNGQAGMLVASASYGKTNLYMYDGSDWKWLVTGSIT